MVIIGHQFVKADWSRFKPKKAVKKYQYGWTQCPKAKEIKMKSPATARRTRSTVISTTSSGYYRCMNLGNGNR